MCIRDRIYGEAARLGYEKVIIPASNLKNIKSVSAGCKAVGVRNIREAMAAFGR